MTTNINSYLRAARKGAEWLLSHQHEDGSIGPPDVMADVYHKAPYALAITGYVAEAYRLVNWIKANDLKPDGELRHFSPSLALYKTNWICQGAHRLAKFDISLPVMSYVLKHQSSCGGFFQNANERSFVEPVCTAWAGMSALYVGHLDAATKVASCFDKMIDQQPDGGKFYYNMTPGGQLIIEGQGAAFIDTTQPAQPYYCAGIALLFLTRLYLATLDETYLDLARRLFEFTLRCADDAYRYPTSAKSAVGASILYSIDGDVRAREAACQLADYLLHEQKPDGWWCNPNDDSIIVRLDHTAEFVVFLSEIAANIACAT